MVLSGNGECGDIRVVRVGPFPENRGTDSSKGYIYISSVHCTTIKKKETNKQTQETKPKPLHMADVKNLQQAALHMAKYVGKEKEKEAQNGSPLQCQMKRGRKFAAAPGISRASALRWPYQWTNGRRPPHPAQILKELHPSIPKLTTSGYTQAVTEMMAITASVIAFPPKEAKEAIKCFNTYALAIFHWAKRQCGTSMHLFTHLVNDAFVNLTVGKNGNEPQMYYDCGDMIVTVLNARAYDTGADAVNNARFNCVSATHFVLLGHLYWREQKWNNAAVSAVYYQLHITIRYDSELAPRGAPEFYENTMGIHLGKAAYTKQIDATIANRDATLQISNFTELVCSHRINALELCRDTLIRGCSNGEAGAWKMCAKYDKVPRSKCGSTRGQGLHFMCAYEGMFTDLRCLQFMQQKINNNSHLEIGFPVVLRRLAIWLAIHQCQPIKPSSLPHNTTNITRVVLTLFKTFDCIRPVEIREQDIRYVLKTVGGSVEKLITLIMSEMEFVYMMTMTTK
jgi:hypothetical protein